MEDKVNVEAQLKKIKELNYFITKLKTISDSEYLNPYRDMQTNLALVINKLYEHTARNEKEIGRIYYESLQ